MGKPSMIAQYCAPKKAPVVREAACNYHVLRARALNLLKESAKPQVGYIFFALPSSPSPHGTPKDFYFSTL
eukprot:scaffold301866_cov26-Tisochrysis_lutea.AAC.5